MTSNCFAIPAFRSRVVPVVVVHDLAHAVPLAHALLEGGIDVMEITLRSSVALQSLEAVAKAVPEMHLGAGTVTRPQEVRQVIDAGARFALSPACTELLLEAIQLAGLPFIPGVMTPSEVLLRREQGFKLLKLFPAEQAGGIAMLKALASPLPGVSFCPTGGVSAGNLRDYLSLPNVAMVGGSWLTPTEKMADKDWRAIAQLAREATTASVSPPRRA